MEFDIGLIVAIVVFLLIVIFVEILIRRTKILLLRKAKNKKQISNIKFLTRVASISIFLFVFLFVFLSYFKSWTGIGVFLGLLTAGLGFALQRPITGVAAWLMMTIKRPFSIGDRIIIGDVRGDVYDITLTHIYLDEVGAGISSGEVTGRNIMIPNYLFFEQNIINYTLTNDFVLSSMDVSITYESDLDKAIEIIERVAGECISEIKEKHKDVPYTRISMAESSMIISLKFYVPARQMMELKSKITKKVYDSIKNEKDVEIAYPHTEMIFRNKKAFMRK
ncbi:MAG: mechanosensitive ion channel family protein [Nanoarchaeota archaeon]|nr:mechanosensitive ion channel family protein [Nanoarchaeota archaeon]